jgi:ComF family protein
MSLRELIEATLVTLFPPRCGACNAALAVRPRYGLCDVCFEVLEPNDGPRCSCCDAPTPEDALCSTADGARCPGCVSDPPAFASLRAPWIYGGGLAELVVGAKFRGREDLAVALGRLLAASDEIGALVEGATAFVPVPLGPKRRRKRGYNQAAVMARTLARQCGAPLRHALRRIRDTAPQSELALAARRANVRGAFVARGRLAGKVVLVDDVITSAATVREAAHALLAAGAGQVVAVAIARANAD